MGPNLDDFLTADPLLKPDELVPVGFLAAFVDELASWPVRAELLLRSLGATILAVIVRPLAQRSRHFWGRRLTLSLGAVANKITLEVLLSDLYNRKISH